MLSFILGTVREEFKHLNHPLEALHKGKTEGVLSRPTKKARSSPPLLNNYLFTAKRQPTVKSSDYLKVCNKLQT